MNRQKNGISMLSTACIVEKINKYIYVITLMFVTGKKRKNVERENMQRKISIFIVIIIMIFTKKKITCGGSTIKQMYPFLFLLL